MRIRGATRAQAWAERLAAPFRRQAAILTYHRVFDASFDPQELCVSPRHFGQHLEVLRSRYRVVPLATLADAVHTGSVGRSNVAITFDDGYADTLALARPALETHHAPATVFAVSGALQSGAVFWWDRLERVLLRPGTLPETLSVKVGVETLSFTLGRWARLGDDDFERLSAWVTSIPEDPTPRHTAYRALWQRLRALPHTAREDLLRSLESQARDLAPLPAGTRSLSTAELRELANSPLVEVGAHTACHEVLATLPTDRQRQEIEGSRSALATVLDRPVRTFSYPYGARSDYTPDTVRLVREAGFACACANFHGLVRRGADPFQLPRVVVRNWDGRGFARRLRIWMGR
jgi:peptidoglycan/xylan/chitin deacetylase (PgdA/CDA1 family)